MGFFDEVGAAQAAGRHVRMAPFVFIDVVGDPVRYWGGHSDLPLASVTWKGFGELVGIPTLQQMANGQASRIQIGISGVSSEGLQLAIRDREQVVGRALKIGMAYFDDDWQPMTGIYWIWRGTMDLTPINRTAGGDGEATRSVAVEAASIFAIRKRPPLGNLTDRDQQAAHPGDRFCERAYLNRFASKKWPKFN